MNSENIQTPKDMNHQRRVGVLLFHGLTGMPSELKPLVKHLTQQGFKVEAPLIRGHGQTHRELLRSTWTDWLKGAQEALDQMRESCDEIFVGGLSMGAMVATALAIRNPGLQGIILLSPHLGLMQENLQYNQWMLPIGYRLKPTHGLFYWTEKPPYGLKDQRLQKKIEKAVLASKKGETGNYGLYRTYIGSIYQMLDLVQFCKKKAHQVQCPVLILQSLEDTITKVENATLIYNLLSSTHKQIRLITGCNHVLSVDLRKKDIAQWMGQFIEHHSTQLNTSLKKLPDPQFKLSAEGFDQLHVDVVPGLQCLSEADWKRLFAGTQHPSQRLHSFNQTGVVKPQLHTVVVKQGETPILYLPIFEDVLHLDSMLLSRQTHNSRKDVAFWLSKLMRNPSVLGVGFPNGAPVPIGIDFTTSPELLKIAWQRVGITLEAFQYSKKLDMLLFLNGTTHIESMRLFWQKESFALIPQHILFQANGMLTEKNRVPCINAWQTQLSGISKASVIAFRHRNSFIQNVLSLIALWLFESSTEAQSESSLKAEIKTLKNRHETSITSETPIPVGLAKQLN